MASEERHLVIGSTLHHADRATVVWGAGFLRAGDRPLEPPRRICAVRGPLSRERLVQLGLPCPEVYGDLALLFPRILPAPGQATVRRRRRAALRGARPTRLGRAPRGPGRAGHRHPWRRPAGGRPDLACRRIASSSLHGLVLADAYGIPSVWLQCSDRVFGQGVKFRDHFEAVGRRQARPVEPTGPLTRRRLEALEYEQGRLDGLEALLAACPFRPAPPAPAARPGGRGMEAAG